MATVIVCRRQPIRTGKLCKFCMKNRTTRLCDQVVKGRTCDAPICDECRTPVREQFDLCPKHKNNKGYYEKVLPK
jgi:hypothetical protein